MNAKRLLMLVALVAPLVAGCANYTQPVVVEKPKTAAEQNFELTWQASLETLRQYNFETSPLRGGFQDRRSGILRSAPLVGKQWWEFWRPDAGNFYDLSESSIQTIYRQVMVQIKETAPGSGQYLAFVEARTLRSDRAVRWENHGASRIYGMFIIPGQARTKSQMLMEQPLEDPNAVLVPLGRDSALETKVTAAIIKNKDKMQLAQAPVEQSQGQ